MEEETTAEILDVSYPLVSSVEELRNDLRTDNAGILTSIEMLHTDNLRTIAADVWISGLLAFLIGCTLVLIFKRK